MVGLPRRSRSDMTKIGALPVPGIFNWWMCVNDVVARSVAGMNRSQASRQVWPGSICRIWPFCRIPTASLRCRPDRVSRTFMFMSKRMASPTG